MIIASFAKSICVSYHVFVRSFKLHLETPMISDDTWQVKRVAGAKPDHHLETLLTVGNGHIAVRGTSLEGTPGEEAASFMHGVWDDMPVTRTELANLPRWWGMDVWVNGRRLSGEQVSDVTWTLDLRDGMLTRELIWQPDSQTKLQVTDQRFCSLDEPNAASVRLTLRVLSGQAVVRLRGGLSVHVDNTGLRHWELLSQSGVTNSVGLRTRTLATGITLVMAAVFDVPGATYETCQADGQPAVLADKTVATGESLVATKYVAMTSSCEAKDVCVTTLVSRLADAGWDAMAAANRRAWAQAWAASDVEIDGDDEAQLAIRYSIFQLLIAAPRLVDSSIGAKTMSGFGYRHHIFWDTEVFMLPLFTLTQPELAARMLEYRWRRLPGARRKAIASGALGARYPWESAGSGDEVCPTWVENPHDLANLIRIWTGDLEQHLNADIARACLQYWHVTGDDDFMRTRGAEMILDTATYWATAAQLEGDGYYHFRDVIGPDEYHEHADDNAFTNAMAAWHLRLAPAVLGWLRQSFPADAESLSAALGIDDALVALWQRVADAIVPAKIKDGVIEQQEGFFDLTDVDFAVARDPARTKSMQALYGIGPTAKTQNLKQPDVLMLAYLLPELFDEQSLRDNYHYYDPRTDHELGSSLGPSISAIIACRVGDSEAARRYFHRAARADLFDMQGNTNDGIHGASAGGLWQAVVFGFAGLQIGPDGWATQPCLPTGWTRLSFSFLWRGERQHVELTG